MGFVAGNEAGLRAASRSLCFCQGLVLGTAVALTPAQGQAQVLTVTLRLATTSGEGEMIGGIRIEQTRYGLVFHPALTGLTPGLRGFHVHTNPTCAPALKDGMMMPAEAAGGHLDPQGTGKHGAPWGDGHLGDLPPLYVDGDGNASQPVLAPRLKVADVVDRSIMVHGGGDNHADHPEPLGGGGVRVACGVIRREPAKE
jgi:Cu-Zn family superoxide dismutase